jgi:hypothetical protein
LRLVGRGLVFRIVALGGESIFTCKRRDNARQLELGRLAPGRCLGVEAGQEGCVCRQKAGAGGWLRQDVEANLPDQIRHKWKLLVVACVLSRAGSRGR